MPSKNVRNPLLNSVNFPLTFAVLLLFLILPLSLMAAGSKLLWPAARPGKMPELFPVSGAYQAYFKLKTDKPSFSPGETAVVDIYLTTTGEEFDAAVAMVEWNGMDFEYEPDSAIGHIKKPNGNPHSFLAAHPGGDKSKIIMSHFVPGGASLMATTDGQPTKFASLNLKVKNQTPASKIVLSSGSSNQALHFVDSEVTNSVNQALSGETQESGVGGPAAGKTTEVSEKAVGKKTTEKSGFSQLVGSILDKPSPAAKPKQEAAPLAVGEEARAGEAEEAGEETERDFTPGIGTAGKRGDSLPPFLLEEEKEGLLASILSAISDFFKDLFGE